MTSSEIIGDLKPWYGIEPYDCAIIGANRIPGYDFHVLKKSVNNTWEFRWNKKRSGFVNLWELTKSLLTIYIIYLNWAYLELIKNF